MTRKCMGSVFKCFMKRYLPVAIVLFVVSVGVLYVQRIQYGDLVRNQEINLVKGEYRTLGSWLEGGVEDVAFLASMVEDELSSGLLPSLKYDEIANIFSNFASQRRYCVQVRYLDINGREVVRINMDQGVAVRVGVHSLQDKAKSDYFRDAMKIDNGVYVSVFNLNKEYGQIVSPHMPVLRFAKRVYKADGEAGGLVVINLSGDELLNFFSSAANESFGRIYFVNDQGGWIVGPEESYNWRFLFSGKENAFFKDKFPEAWAQIGSQSSGQFLSDEGLYTFTSMKEATFPGVFTFNVNFKEGWKVVSFVKSGKLSVPWSNVTLLLISVLFCLSGFFFWRKTLTDIERDEFSAKLQESKKLFMDVANAAGEFIWETGPDGCFVFVTGRAQDILGYSAQELLGRSPFDFVDEESSWDVRKEFLDAANNGQSFSGLVFRFINREGHKLWLEFNGVPVFDENGAVRGFRGATSDITAERVALQSLQDRENMLQSISDSVQDALVLMDEKGIIHFWNPAAEKIFGYSAEEMLGESLSNCVHAEDNEEFMSEGEVDVNTVFSNYGSFTVNVRRKGGAVFPAEVLLSPLSKDEEWWVVGTIRDVTERKEAEDELRRLATTDSLTGLNNRRFFMERAEEALQRSVRYGHELSLLMLDIDFFKTVNDTYGHDAGDDVLKGLSAIGLKVLRNIDVFGRIGGEEFSVLLPDTGIEGAKLVAERLRLKIEQTRIATRSGELSITVSIGVASFNEVIRTLEHLLKAADLGLYAAKEDGRNRVKVQRSPDVEVEK